MQKDSIDSQMLPQKGKKLFLPKIDYNRLENTTESWSTAQQNRSSDEFIVQDTIVDNDSQGFISPVITDQDRTSGFFTKFSVLPPIQADKGGSKEKPNQRDKRRFESISDPILSEHDLKYKRKADTVLHGQNALLTGDIKAVTLQRTNTDNLKIANKRYSDLNNKQNIQETVLTTQETIQSRAGNLLSRPSTTPNASHHLALRLKPSPLTDNCNETLGLIGAYTDRAWPQLGSRRLSKLRRFNSDTSNEGKYDTSQSFNSVHKGVDYSPLTHANLPTASLLLTPSENTGVNGKSFTSICRSPRPISRCHIDINVNESENKNVNLMEDRKVETNNPFDTTTSADVASSEHFIQISEEYSSSEDQRERQNPPSIQILIKSLDSAKEEKLQDEKLELPKMSVREQRRRSALCRANSKQVDDFLLVHNLKDLGLL